MKFYLVCGSTKIEDSDGQWTTRADAEQAAKDAVEMAHLVQTIIRGCFFQLEYTSDDKYEDDEDYKKAQAIIERHEGGKG